jgi:predicted ATPase/class 3 adenylate cyclase
MTVHPTASTKATMTFLFTDIEGSTRQWETVPEMSERVQRHFEVLDGAVEAVGGEVFARMGDGIAAAFASADAAVHAAIDAQRQMAALGLDVRMGVHTGEVERVGSDFRGRPVNRAARIMAAGHGGQILLSDVAAALVRVGSKGLTFADLGSHRLRDLVEPERMWQLLHPDLSARLLPVRGVDSYATNLPTQRSSLVGRREEVERAIELLSHHRIVTLTGVGGVGKTRLAVQVAAEMLSQFATVCFVELASVADADDVADVVALALGSGTLPASLAAAGAMIGDQHALIVFDNCEHVVDSAADVIDTLTADHPNLSVLATSREALGIDGEYVLGVRSLDEPTAVELFLQRAEAAGAEAERFDSASVAHICRRLDRIPLAIELAAARAATLGLAAVDAALDDRFSILSGGRRRSVDRHGTMRATIDWSYRLLDDDERRLFKWLAVFPNGFELDAASHIARLLGISEPATHDVVASLVHKSMIAAEPTGETARYRMLETMRAFALEQLDDRGDRPAAWSAHAEWVATLTDLSIYEPCTAAVERNAIRLERESDSWRDATTFAVRSGSADLAGRLCGPPVAFFLLGRHDLADLVRPLVDLVGIDNTHRRVVLTALICSGAGTASAAQLRVWADDVQALDDDDPSGLGPIMQWLAFAWSGDVPRAIEVCLRASIDERLAQTTRDMFIGIATLDHFSLTESNGDTHCLIDQALEVAARTDVALQRVTCLLGAAWGLGAQDPERSMRLVHDALCEIGRVPALTRLTLPGNASRLLARLDPSVAAQGLLEQLNATPSRRSFVDLIPIFYATALLHRVGHPSSDTMLPALTGNVVPAYLSMMDFVDLARRAAATTDLAALGELESVVRSALDDVSRADGRSVSNELS